MKADDYQMSKVFLGGGDIQYVLPIFQREYAWEWKEWQTLLKDILEIYDASEKENVEHFLGSLVVIDEDGRKPLFQTYTLVDGQQRLTSISILLCALRDLLDDGDSLSRRINRYLYNDEGHDELRYKILPTAKYDDRKTYFAILNGNPVAGMRSRIVDAYTFFKAELLSYIDGNRVEPQRLFDCVLSSLYIVFIELNRTDKPYRIFESLNHRGKALTQADLVRNYIAMRLPVKRQQEVFDREWSKIEDKLSDRRETARIPELTAFLRYYLALHLGVLPQVDRVYENFKDRIEKRMNASDDEFIHEIGKLNRFASFYDNLLRPDNEAIDKVKEQLKRLNILEPATAYPLLMYFYDLFDSREIDENEFLRILRVLENYLARRFLAGEPTNYLNTMFPRLANDLQKNKEKSARSLEAALGERNYPSDNRLRQRLMWNRLYSANKSRRIVFVMESLNQQCFDSDIKLDGQGTVEHIMPQSLSAEWKEHLGSAWEEIHREHLHTLGNLTIVTQDWNTRKLSNRPYSIKREALQEHGIHLNSKYFNSRTATWDTDAIRVRANYLADLILKTWPAFTEPPRSEGVKGKRPLTLTVQDERFAVYNWRDMLMQMVNFLHKERLLTDFNEANREFQWRIERDKGDSPKFYRESSAGWWIYVNLTAEDAVRFCGMLAKHCGLQEDEWSFTCE